MVNSAGDWGKSDPLAVPELIQEMKRRGHPEADIQKVVYDNPLAFFSQSQSFRFTPREASETAAAALEKIDRYSKSVQCRHASLLEHFGPAFDCQGLDRAAIDRLWNRFVAAWFEKGKDDPKLALLRFDPERAVLPVPVDPAREDRRRDPERLAGLLDDVPDWPGRADEGWILGAGHSPTLSGALA